jgi:hypothetical protein
MGIEPTSEAWEALDKTLKAIDLAALSFPSASIGNLVETETPDKSNGLGSGLGRLANHILSFEAEMSRRSQQMCVIRINDAETRLGRRRQVNSIRRAQKHSCRQLLIDVADSQEHFLILSKPLECACLDVCPQLGQ